MFHGTPFWSAGRDHGARKRAESQASMAGTVLNPHILGPSTNLPGARKPKRKVSPVEVPSPGEISLL